MTGRAIDPVRRNGTGSGEPLADLDGYETVARWLSGLPSPSARRHQLDVLRRFCEAEGADPDTLIACGTSSRDAKNDAMRRLARWVESEADDERARHELQTIVRGFYIRNGLRVLTKPYTDVYRRPRGTV